MREFEDRPSGGMYIEGRNAVTEALRAGTALDKLYIVRGETDHTLSRIAAQARKAGAVVVECDRRKLDAMPPGRHRRRRRPGLRLCGGYPPAGCRPGGASPGGRLR